MRSIIVNVLLGLALSGACYGQTAQQDSAAKTAQATIDSIQVQDVEHVEDTGEDGEGTFIINGETIDAKKLAPGANKANATRASTLNDSAENLNNLKSAYEAEAAVDPEDGLTGEAERTVDKSVRPMLEEKRKLEEDEAFFQQYLLGREEAKQGKVGGVDFGSCETTETKSTTNANLYTLEEAVCEITNTPGGASNNVCTRVLERASVTGTITQEKSGILLVNGEVNGNICKKDITAAGDPVYQDQSFAQALNFPSLSSGDVCTTTRTATTVEVWNAKSKVGLLSINKESNGLLCKRDRWAETVETGIPGSQAGTLNILGTTNGRVCSRTRWPTVTTVNTQKVKAAVLTVNTEPNAQVFGERWHWPTSAPAVTAQALNSTLSVNKESNLAICTRAVVPTAVNTDVAGASSATLNIDTQVDGLNICKRTITPTAGTTTQAVALTRYLNVNKELGGVEGTRTRWPSTETQIQTGTQSGVLDVNVEANNTAYGSKWHWPTQAAQVTSQAMNAVLSTNKESNAAFCSRTIVPTASSTNIAGTKSAELNIDTQQNGVNICKRTITPTAGTSVQAVSFAASLTVNKEKTEVLGTRTRWPTASTTNVSSTEVGLLNVNEEVNDVEVGRKWHWPTANSGSVNQSFGAALNINTDSSGVVATKAIWAVTNATPTPGSHTGTLNIDTQVPGNICSRTVWPTAGVGSVGGSHTASLSVNTESPGNVATRAHWPTTTSGSTGGSQAATLSNFPTGVSGNTGTVSRWVTLTPGVPVWTPPSPGTLNGPFRDLVGALYTSTVSFTLNVPPGTPSISALQVSPTYTRCITDGEGYMDCSAFAPVAGSVTLTQTPSSANGWQGIFKSTAPNATGGQFAGWEFDWTITWTNSGFNTPSPDVKNFTVQNTSTPLQAGPQCSTGYACTANAPTTINGIAVSAADVSALPALYPSAGSTCTAANVTQTCSGSETKSNSVSIAASLPGGTTAISGFGFTVSNPQSGIAVNLTQTPSLANSWVAVFSVVKSGWTVATVAPEINMTWTVPTSSTTWAINETGDISGVGTGFCPAQWSCTQSAPATINGVSVSTAMAQAQPLLFSGASNTCLAASKDRVCSGSASTTTNVSIAGQVAPGATAISGFNFNVLNPQSGVTVSLLTAPSAANSWVASFNVTRTNWASVPAAPNISLSWTASVPAVNTSVQDSGSCSATGTANCPATWSCTNSAPYTVNGISVTEALAGTVAPLFPGASGTCVTASQDKVCSGTANTQSTIDISSKIAGGVTSISNFNFAVSNPTSGVVVSVVSAPSLANGWVATFNVARSNWAAGLPQPALSLSWTMDVPGVALSVNSTGDENATGTATCPASWTCSATAPQTINGIAVSAGMAATQAPLYPGATNNACTNATKSKVCSGGAVLTTIDISGQLAAGTTSISGFAIVITNPQAGVTASVTQVPSALNGWNAIIQTSRSNWTFVPVAPNVTLSWTAATNTTSFAQQTSGNVSASGTAACPTQWSCGQTAPATVNGINVTVAEAQAQPLLYAGASNVCLSASLKSACSGNSDVTTTLNISSKIQGGVTAINNFSYAVNNPAPGVTVALVSAPSLANGWVATFKTTRSNWSAVPAKPSITMSWDQDVPSVSYSLQETGVLSGTNSANCSVNWSCTQSAPAVINGINLTAAMVSGEALLYPGAAPACLVGEFKNTCTGSHTSQTTVNIASQLPAGTQSISNFGFVVSNPTGGVVVSVSQVPNAGNGWNAVFNVVRSSWVSVPADPAITINFDATVGTVAVAVVDSGVCSGVGTTSCPAVWSCEASAPTTIGGVPVDLAMAASKAPLYPGAASSCAIGSRDTQCSGSADTTTTVDISGDLPANTTGITGFSFTVSNAQPGVSVSLTAAPSAANSWVASFKVSRTNWSGGLVKPNITLNWTNVVSTITTAVSDSGVCTGTGTASCPVAWSCKDSAPIDVGGITVTPALAASHFPLFPGASNTCVTGEFKRVCSGSGALDSNISIAPQLPANTTSIRNFSWLVVNPQAGVQVLLLSAPSAGNLWTASFRVTRTTWTSTPVDAEISMSWDADHTVTNYTQESSGNITATGSLNCPAQWSCSQSAPDTVNGVMVLAAVANTLPKLYTGATGTCLKADLKGVCSGVADTTTVLNIAGNIAGGVTAISNFTFTVNNPQTGVSVALISAPTSLNGWNATFKVSRSVWGGVPVQPNITMNWEQGVPVVTYAIQDVGNFTGTSTASCSVGWSCKTLAPSMLNGINVTSAMAIAQPLLFPGADGKCLVGEFKRTCSGAQATQTTIDISGDLPAGTTSISGVTFTVANPQPGVSVSMTAAPSAANSWVATFTVTRTNWAAVPADPAININFFADVGTVSVAVVDDQSCAGAGTAQCPAVWSCPTVAPTTVNGLSVDTIMANSKAPLYAGAPNNCVIASRDTQCSGSALTTTAVDLSAQIPANTTAINGFSFTVTNPTPNVTVSLLTAPSAANSWVATFRTTRSTWVAGLPAPNISMTWNNVVSTVTTAVVDTPACMDAPTPTCPTSWTCTGSAPKTIGGIPVTTAMAANHAPLFPGAASTCVEGDFKRVCSGSGAMDTSISIAGTLPANTTSVRNFSWVVTNVQAGVSVNLLSAPSAANLWTASFRVTRTNWTTVPVDPTISMNWDADHTQTNYTQQESGDLTATGTASCPATWECTETAPGVINGVGISAETAQGLPLLYGGASNVCTRARLKSVCTGTADTFTDVSIADVVGSETAISGFTFQVMNVQGGISVSLLVAPSLANNWVAQFRVRRSNWTVIPEAPNLNLKWTQSESTISYSVEQNGTCTESASAVCSTAWSCRTDAPATLNGVAITADMVSGETPLFSGANTSCLVGDLDMVCSGSQTTETTLDISGNIPVGTTVINNFGFTVENQQPGVVVSLISAPSSANGWQATFGVTRSDWAVSKVPPQIVMNWNRPESNVVFSVQETGDCSGVGTASCPATWKCDSSAPTSINGLAITSAMLSGETPLYSGGSSSCTTASLNRTCPAQISESLSLDVSSEIPAGVTAIRNVSFEVLNPQSGVSISLLAAPSAANSWVAQFSVQRTDLNSVPADPEVRVSFEAQESTVDVGTTTTCEAGAGGGMAAYQPGMGMLSPLFVMAQSGGGGGSCSESWVCTANAPTTINGALVTPEMLAGLPELYPGAASTCAAAKVVRNCSGTLVEETNVSIAALIPGGTTDLLMFNWEVTNPQPGMTVSQIEPPSLSNGWVGRYAVARDYSTAETAVAPNLRLTWRIQTGVNAVLGVTTTGVCDETPTTNCAAVWTCDAQAPGDVSGFNVTAAMLTGQGVSLFAGGETCLKASLNRVCSGAGGNETVIDISDVVPVGATAITNFAYSVTTPIGDVNVVLISEPSLLNGWKATFRTERSDWTVLPAGQPAVKLTWSVDGQPVQGLVAVDNGDCSITGDAFCGTKWVCTAYADGSGTTGVSGSLAVSLRPMANEPGIQRAVSIASLIPAGTTSLSNVQYTENAMSTSSAILTDLPTLANNWVAIFEVTGDCYQDGTEIVMGPGKVLRMHGLPGSGTFCEPATGTLSWTANVEGSGQTGGTAVGDAITEAEMAGVSPIYPGAPAMCIAAKKVYDCTGMNDGTVCSEGETGEVCDNVVGGPVNTCAELEADANCSLQSTACNEDALGTNGFCYLTEKMFKCKKPVPGGSNTTVTSTTTCNTIVPVCTGSGCGPNTVEEETSSQVNANKTFATMAMLNTILTDFSGGETLGSAGDVGATAQIAQVSEPLVNGGLAMGGPADPLPAPGSDPSGWDPWIGPENDETPVGTPSGTTATGSLTFFSGKSTNCKKALGGLLNCCTKNTPQSGNNEWWKMFTSSMTKGFAGVAACTAPTAPGGWSQMGTGSTSGNAALSAGFTSALETMTGGGSPLACQQQKNLKMSSINDSFMNYANTIQKPSLAWYCSSREYDLAVQKKLGSCSYIGSYCNTSVLGVCLDKRQRYCCFNSPMTRMFREQLNTQGVVSMGTAKNPKCGGISFDQMKQLNMAGTDTGELEGLMFEAGAIPSFGEADFTKLLEEMTGPGSLIGNTGREMFGDRTRDMMSQVDVSGTKTTAENQVISTIPNSPAPATPTAGKVSFGTSQIYVTRGNAVILKITRTGGVGAASVQLTAVNGSAVSGTDFELTSTTVSWADGDTSAKEVRVVTYNSLPLVTVNKQFEVTMSVSGGGVQISPSGRAIVVIQPRE